MHMYNINNLTTIYVSQKDGSDKNQGFFANNNDMNSGPLKTIEKALSMVAEMRSFGAYQPVTIKIMDDEYCVDKTIHIDNSIDSVTIEPYQKTQLRGAVKIDWFKDDEFNGVKCVSADLNELKETDFSDFYINGKRAKVTRYPQKGFLLPETVENLSSELYAGSKWFIAKEEDYKKIQRFKNIENCIISFNHYWVDEHTPIESIEDDTRKITFKYRSIFTIEPTHPASALEYIVENVSEMFLNPGEWYYDKENMRLYYIPEDTNTNAEDIVGYIPTVTNLIKIEGTDENKVKNITIRDFDIAYTNGHRISASGKEVQYASDPQSVFDTGAMIEIKNASGCAIERCSIRCAGLHSIAVREGTVRMRIFNNSILQSGAGGIVINGGEYGSEEKTHTHSNIVVNNKIIGCGKKYCAGCGILIMHSYGNTISHNEIAETYYTGISCGWVWGYGNSITRDNHIEKNHIHNIGGGVLSDMGGIYMLGRQSGTIVRENLIHDVRGAHYGGWGIYTDEGSSYILIEKNICYNTNMNSFHQHFGHSNTVRNNIFAFSNYAPLDVMKPELHIGVIFERNIVISHGQNAIVAGYVNEGTGCLQVISLNNNIFYDTKTQEPTMIQVGKKEYSFKEYKEEFNIDIDSVCADPGFENLDNYDFRLKSDSVAFEMGFKPINMSDVGPIE